MGRSGRFAFCRMNVVFGVLIGIVTGIGTVSGLILYACMLVGARFERDCCADPEEK